MKTITAMIALAGFSIAAHANPPQTAVGASPRTAVPSAHALGGPADMSKSDAPLTRKGKVLSTVDTTGFIYIEVQDGGKKFWVVSPTIALKKSDSISFADAPVQAKYHSASLNRDFSNILFTTRVVVEK